jgi:hypothetical protein
MYRTLFFLFHGSMQQPFLKNRQHVPKLKTAAAMEQNKQECREEDQAGQS